MNKYQRDFVKMLIYFVYTILVSVSIGLSLTAEKGNYFPVTCLVSLIISGILLMYYALGKIED